MVALSLCALAAANLVFALQQTLILGGGESIFHARRRRQSSSHINDKNKPTLFEYLTKQSEDGGGKATFDSDGGDFDILLALVDAAGLEGALSSSDDGGGLDDVTLFAPRDDAFHNLAEDLGYGGESSNEEAIFYFLRQAMAALAGEEGIKVETAITDMLHYHIVDGAMKEKELRRKDRVSTLYHEEKIKVVKARKVEGEKRTKVISRGSNAIMHKRKTDIKASNGNILHVIKDVLLHVSFDEIASASKAAEIAGNKTPSPTKSRPRSPTSAPTVRKEEATPTVASPTAVPASVAPCVPTTGPCISTEADFREVTGNLAPNDTIAICGNAENDVQWTFQMRTSTIITQDNITLCCAGPNKCRIRAQKSDQGLPIDRILVVTGENFTMRDMSLSFGTGGRSMIFLTGNDFVGNAGGGNLAIVSGGKHLISDCYFGGAYGGKPLVGDPANFYRGNGGNLYFSTYGGEVKLIRTTIEKGVAQLGGGAAIVDTSHVILEDCVVQGNEGSGLFTTSGFMSDPAQVIEFRGTTFHSNQGDWGGGFMASAIGALPTLLIEDCIFENNSAYNGGAGAVFPDLGKFASLRFTNNGGGGNSAEAAPPAVLAEDVCDGLLLATIDPARPEYSYKCFEDMTEFVNEVSES